MYTEKQCEQCGITFQALNREINRGFGRFCTRHCAQVFNSRLRYSKNLPNTTCANCGADFYRNPSKLALSRSGLHFCSRACKDVAQRIDGLKDLHPPHYGTGTGGSTYRQLAFRSFPHYCNRCKWDIEPGILIVHHKDRDRTHNKVENLELLCPNCHEHEHFQAGDGRWGKRKD